MTIQLDHSMAPSHTRDASAKQLAHILGVPCWPAKEGPFFSVYINDSLTLDFIETDEPFPIEHYCFRVDDETFDTIFKKLQAAGIEYCSTVRGPMDSRINTSYDGRMIY